jgi:hypothetical protein
MLGMARNGRRGWFKLSDSVTTALPTAPRVTPHTGVQQSVLLAAGELDCIECNWCTTHMCSCTCAVHAAACQHLGHTRAVSTRTLQALQLGGNTAVHALRGQCRIHRRRRLAETTHPLSCRCTSRAAQCASPARSVAAWPTSTSARRALVIATFSRL